MVKLTIERGAVELTEEQDLTEGGLLIESGLSRLVGAEVLVQKAKRPMRIRWPFSMDGVRLVVPLRRGAEVRERKGRAGKRSVEGKVGSVGVKRGFLSVGDVVVWTAYGE